MNSTRRKAFTVLELLCVTAIVGLVVAITVPVYRNAVLGAKTNASIQRLRQFHLAFALYRDEWGHSGFDSVSALAQPSISWFYSGLGGAFRKLGDAFKSPDYLASPCGYNPFFDPPGSGGVGYYYCTPLDFAMSAHWSRWRENSLTVYDFQCNPGSTRVWHRHEKKRSLGLLFSGQVVNRYATGDVHHWDFYADPPD